MRPHVRTRWIGWWVAFGAASTIALPSAAVGQVHVETEIDITVFHQELAPYGDWVSVADYGWVWTPSDVPPGWRPYTMGQWSYSDDDGWLWMDDAEWGWAPFHYGRWYLDDTFGWAWVPGTEWAPAWVAWRTDDEYVGWAPLPPQARWRAEIGIDFGGIDIDVAIGPSSWCFVAEREILEPRIYTRAVLPARNVTLLRTTRYETRYTVRERRIVNAGVSIDRVERRLGRPVPRTRVRAIDSITTLRTSPRVVGREVAVYRPRVVRRAEISDPRIIRKRSPFFPATDTITVRQKTTRSAFKEYQESQRTELHRLQRRELESASPESRAQLLERHEVERRALDHDVQRRSRQLDNRQRLEREGALRGSTDRKRSTQKDRGRDNDDDKKTTRRKRP